MAHKFVLKLENDRLLNGVDLFDFCVNTQYQDIEIIVNNEGHCLSYCGVYDILEKFKFNSVKIITSNILEKHNRYIIDTKDWLRWFSASSQFDFDFDYTWTEEKIFGCVYGRPSAARLGIAAYVKKHYPNDSLILTKFDFQDENSRNLFDLQRLFSWHPESIYDLEQLASIEMSPYPYWRSGLFDYYNPLCHTYKSFLIDLVVEPVYHGDSFYPTEKIVRAMLCRRPFIVMGSKDYLNYLRHLGFHTFNEFWSEDYDGYDGKTRYLMILDLIDQIGRMPKSKLIDIYYSCMFQVEHNIELLKKHGYKKTISGIL